MVWMLHEKQIANNKFCKHKRSDNVKKYKVKRSKNIKIRHKNVKILILLFLALISSHFL